MATVDAEYLIRLSAGRAVPVAGGGTISEDHSMSWLKTYTASASREVFSASGSMSDADTLDYDFGLLNQYDGDGVKARDLSMSKVQLIALTNTTTGTSGDIKVGAAASNPWIGAGTPFEDLADTITIPAGGVWVWSNVNGGNVSASSDVLRLTCSGSQTFDLLIVGDT